VVYALRRPLTLLGSFVALALLVVTWGSVIRTLQNVEPVPQAVRPTAIVWAGRVFANPAALGRWLRSRGATYRAWRAAHPAPAAILEHRPPPRVAKPSPPKPRPVPHVAKPPAPAPKPHAAPATPSAQAAIVRAVVCSLLLLLAAALAAAALQPAALRRRFPELAARIWNYRTGLATASVAIVLGLAVAVGLS
jgi:hypothetical protein